MALSLKESLLVGLSDFWSRKIRAIITIFSIILGIMSIIVVQSLVKSVQESTLSWMMERGGLARLDIEQNYEFDNPRNLPTYLTLREFQYLRSQIHEAEEVSPIIYSWRASISHRDLRVSSYMQGVLPEYPRIEEWGVTEGRFISSIDINNQNDVIVIGSTIREELFGSRQALGQFITYENRRYQVIGVMKRRFFKPQGGASIGSDNFFEFLNRYTFLPISTLINKTSARDEIRSVQIKAASLEETPVLQEKIDSILLNLRQGDPVFRVNSAKEAADQMAGGTAVFGLVFTVISLISLLVGGIVIMNIMMATVNERTREIGIRMAVGARRFDVFMQFIIQTVIITLIGAIIGIILGLSILDLVGQYIGFTMTASTGMVIFSIIVAAIIGILFGVLPAIKASNLDPVKCLSYE